MSAAAAQTSITARGRFSLEESIGFGFGPRTADPGGSVMRMAFVVDGYAEQVGVVIGKSGSGDDVVVEIHGDADPAVVTAQVARILSLDVDSTCWDTMSAADELLSRLVAEKPGLRPPLFHSAYEALGWSVLSARRPRQQMSVLRDKLAAVHGSTHLLAGRELYAFPTPEQLLAVETFPGLPEVKLRRLHGVARAALAGDLDTAALRAMQPTEAATRLQQLEGVGPFYASLVIIRALGSTDVPAADEKLLLGVLGELLDRPGPVSNTEFLSLAQAWRPWRTWASVLIRAAGPALLAPDSKVGRASTSR